MSVDLTLGAVGLGPAHAAHLRTSEPQGSPPLRPGVAVLSLPGPAGWTPLLPPLPPQSGREA